MVVKGSDEGTPPVYGGRECSGGWFQFLFRGSFGYTMSSFPRKKLARHCHKRREIFSMSEKTLFHF